MMNSISVKPLGEHPIPLPAEFVSNLITGTRSSLLHSERIAEIHSVPGVSNQSKFRSKRRARHTPFFPKNHLMPLPRPTQLAHSILREIIHAGDTVIDATAGNGHDTLFLATCVGREGKVLAFDIQQAAIDSARAHIKRADVDAFVEFHETSHARMADFAEPGSISAVMFNLGYLPGEAHDVTTTSSETLAALAAAAQLLKPGGVISVVCYPGHEGGESEANSAESWLATQTSGGWRVAKYAMLGTKRPAPFLLIASKGI
jgi:SAM-dependent methyltransferase